MTYCGRDLPTSFASTATSSVRIASRMCWGSLSHEAMSARSSGSRLGGTVSRPVRQASSLLEASPQVVAMLLVAMIHAQVRLQTSDLKVGGSNPSGRAILPVLGPEKGHGRAS